MKRILLAIVAVSSVFSLTGCGEKKAEEKKPEEVLKMLEENDYKVWVSDVDDILGLTYDKKLQGYNYGEKVDNDRLLTKPKKIKLEIASESNSFQFENNGKTVVYTLDGFSGVYYYAKDFEKVELYDDSLENYSCVYYLNGEESDDVDICKSSFKDEANKAQKEFEKELKGLGITKQELLTFSKWVEDDLEDELLDKLKDKFDKQKDLTASDIQGILEDNNYEVSKTETGAVLITRSENSTNIRLEGKLDENNSIQGLVFKVESEYMDPAYPAYLEYNFKTKEELVISNDGVYKYNVETYEGYGEHPDEFNMNAIELQSEFEQLLSICRITKEDLTLFIKNYK